MSNQSKKIRYTVLALGAVCALFAGVFISAQMSKPHKIDPSKFHGTVLSQPREISAFNLEGIDDKPFNNQSLNGQWTMVFFGFTNCGYLCPTTMAELGKFYKILEKNDVKTLPNVVMVSIDPARDSKAKLSTFVKAFNSHFYGARGTKEHVQAMTRELGVVYAKIALNGKLDDETYDIEHTGTVLLFNPQGQLSAFFTSPQNASLLVEDFTQLTV